MKEDAPRPKAILLVDDEPNAVDSFAATLTLNGFPRIIRCHDSRDVPSILVEEEVGVVLLDLMMPHLPGEALLPELLRAHPETAVIVITGAGDVETAVNCMRRGAEDFLLKPVPPDRLVQSVRQAMEPESREAADADAGRARPRGQTPPRGVPGKAFARIITESPKMHALFRHCEAIAETPHPVLITGETGAGKELIAEALHQESGRSGPFVAINVAGLDDAVFSDTLFGHTRGAFTGAEKSRRGLVESAAGGTLFLDEIGDLGDTAQVKLLRLLEKGEYYPVGADRVRRADTRFLFATNRGIDDLRRCPEFRNDLYYRLRTHHVNLPPLRERPEDIAPLLDHFLARAAGELEKKKPAYHGELITLLSGYHFPGNVRELKAMVFDAMGKHGGRMLSCRPFREYIRESREAEAEVPRAREEFCLSGVARLPTLKEISRLLIQETMRRSGNNQRVVATLLGISPQTLNKRLKTYAKHQDP